MVEARKSAPHEGLIIPFDGKPPIGAAFFFGFHVWFRNKANLRSLALFDHRCGKEVPHKSQKPGA
jgi:hypothetical protein